MAAKTTSIRTSFLASKALDIQVVKINKARKKAGKYELSKSECAALALINFDPQHGINER